jgi:hypothetical protein
VQKQTDDTKLCSRRRDRMTLRQLPWWLPLNTILPFVILAPDTYRCIYKLTQWCERHRFGSPVLFHVCGRCQRAQATCERNWLLRAA